MREILNFFKKLFIIVKIILKIIGIDTEHNYFQILVRKLLTCSK